MNYVELQSWIERFYAKLFQDLVQDEDFPAIKILKNIEIECTYIQLQYYFTSIDKYIKYYDQFIRR